MPETAPLLFAAERSYRGTKATPERWMDWRPHKGDVIVCTPAKCGTTWTQSILTMLLYGTVDLPDRVSVLAPWVDSSFDDADYVADVPLSPSGRRVVKTHAPSDGFPVWDGVHVVAVYRHPFDVFISMRKHLLNMKELDGGPLAGPVSEALELYLNKPFDAQDADNDRLATLTTHYLNTVNRPHQRGLVLMHYADMVADHRGAVAQLANALEIDADDALIDAITDATAIKAMRADPAKFAPEGGKGFWHNDAEFFSKGGTHQWEDVFKPSDISKFEAKLASLLPNEVQRDWIKFGDQASDARITV